MNPAISIREGLTIGYPRKRLKGQSEDLRLAVAEETISLDSGRHLLLARNGRVFLKPIGQPEVEFESVVEVFDKALAQEQTVTQQIDGLYELAFQEKAFAALVELEWFITEQVEEEKTAREIVHKFHMVKDDPASLLDLDRELNGRAPEAAEGA